VPTRRLNEAVPSELETILLKTMAKDPAERFATAQEFADDLARYLANEPIHARRPSLLQCAAKWTRRHRAGVAAGVLALCATTAASVIGALGIAREERATRAALSHAEANLGLALEALDKVYLEEVYLDEAEATPSLRRGLSTDLLEKGLGFYRRFAEENGADRDLQQVTGRAWTRAGQIYRRLGRQQEADEAFDQAVTALRGAIRARPDRASAHRDLGHAFHKSGQLDDAIAAYREVIRLEPESAIGHCNLGAALIDKHLLDEGIPELRQAIRLMPDYALAHSNLGAALSRTGFPDDAIAEYRKALHLQSDLGLAHYNLGVELVRKGLTGEAITEYREAIRYMPEFGAAYGNLANILSGCCLPDPAFVKPDEAVELATKAVSLAPRHAGLRSTLGIAHYRAGHMEAALEALEMPLSRQRRGLEVYDWLFAAMAHWRLGHRDEAHAWHDRALAWIAEHPSDEPELKALAAEAAGLIGSRND